MIGLKLVYMCIHQKFTSVLNYGTTYGTSTYILVPGRNAYIHTLGREKPARIAYLSFDCDIDKFYKEVYICLKRKQIYTARNKKIGKCTVLQAQITTNTVHKYPVA